jgi:hypothetical protein
VNFFFSFMGILCKMLKVEGLFKISPNIFACFGVWRLGSLCWKDTRRVRKWRAVREKVLYGCALPNATFPFAYESETLAWRKRERGGGKVKQARVVFWVQYGPRKPIIS